MRCFVYSAIVSSLLTTMVAALPIVSQSETQKSSPTISSHETDTGLGPVLILFHTSGKFAYVLNSGENTISQYAYDEDSGKLSAITPAKVAAPPAATFGNMFDPSGK